MENTLTPCLKELHPHLWQRPPRQPEPGEGPQLWLIRTAVFREEAAARAGSVLEESEKAKAAAFKRLTDRHTYQAAHVGLRLLLGAYLGVAPAGVPIRRQPCPLCQGPHGRPFVPGAALHFSLSHSGPLSLLAFAAAPVGVDVEAISDLATADGVGKMLHPRETAELSGCLPEDRPLALARAWTRKEAYLKGLGTGLGRGLSRDYLGTSPDGAAQMTGWTITDVPVDKGFAAAVAAREETPSEAT